MGTPSSVTSDYLKHIETAVKAIESPHFAGRYFIIKDNRLGVTEERPNDLRAYEKEMTAYITTIRKIHDTRIDPLLEKMQILVSQQLKLQKQAVLEPKVLKPFSPTAEYHSGLDKFYAFLHAYEHQEGRPYLNIVNGQIGTTKQLPEDQDATANEILDIIDGYLAAPGRSPEDETAYKYILEYLSVQCQNKEVLTKTAVRCQKLLYMVINWEESRAQELKAPPKIDLDERAPVISLPKDRAIIPRLEQIAFQNCKNEKEAEKKAVEGLASLRFERFVALGDLKQAVSQMSPQTPEEKEDFKAKKAILDWMDKNGSTIPPLAQYAGDRLEGMSDIEQFYVNLYHEFQSAPKAEIEKQKESIKAALSYQDLYALQLLRLMKRNDPPLTDIQNVPKKLSQKATSAAYSNKSLIEYYVENYTKQIKAARKDEIEKLEKQVAAIEDLKQKLAEMDPKKTGYEAVKNQIEQKIADLEKDNPRSQLQVLISNIKEDATTQAVKENLPVVVAAGFYKPARFNHDILELLEGPPPLPALSARCPLLLASEEEMTTGDEKDIRLYTEVMLSRYVEQGKLLQHQKEVILDEIGHLIDNYKIAFPNKTPDQIFRLCIMAARTMVYQEYYDKAAFTGSDHGTKHIHHNIAMANQFVSGIKGLNSLDVKKKDIFAIQFVHIFHDFGYSSGLGGINFNACKDHPIISAAFMNAHKNFFVELLDPETYDAVVRSVEKHAIIRPDFTPDQSLFHKTFTDKVQPNLVRALTSTSDSCALTADRKTQEFWEDLEAIKIAARLKVFVTNHPEYQDKFSPPPPQTYAENYREQLIRSSNPMDRLAAEIYDSVLNDLISLIQNNPNMHEDLKERYIHAIQEQFSFFAANMVVGQFGATLEGVGVRRNPGAGPKYLPEFNMTPSALFSILEVGFGEKEAFTAFKKLLDEFSAKPDNIEKATKDAAAKLRQIYEAKSDFERKYPFCRLEEAENLTPENYFRRAIFPRNSQVNIMHADDVAEFVKAREAEGKKVIPIDDPTKHQTSPPRGGNEVYVYSITTKNRNAYNQFQADYRAAKIKIQNATKESEHDVHEANAHFHIHAHAELEKPKEYRFGDAAGRRLAEARGKQAVTGPTAAPFARVLQLLSFGTSIKAEIEEGLRKGNAGTVINFLKNVKIQAPELQTALGSLSKINEDWQVELKPINNMFDGNKDSIGYDSGQQVLKQYIKELSALRDNPAKFTEKAVNDLNEKYKKQFEAIDTFYAGYGIKINFKEKFESSTKSLSLTLPSKAAKWGEGEKLLKLCFTYLTTQNTDENIILFLLPNKAGNIKNDLEILKKDAKDKLNAQNAIVQSL